jgi:hypothetical protein
MQKKVKKIEIMESLPVEDFSKGIYSKDVVEEEGEAGPRCSESLLFWNFGQRAFA